MKMPSTISEADVVFNRAQVALAKNQRLVASWLPPPTAEEIASKKTEQELEREEQELFRPVPEWLGVGAPIPKDVDANGLPRRKELSSTDKLRKQLLGKDAFRKNPSLQPVTSKPTSMSHKPGKPVRSKDESEDEEEGRAATFQSKKAKSRSIAEKKQQSMPDTELAHTADTESMTTAPKGIESTPSGSTASSRKRPATSFLDEMLEKRKKKKKKNKAKTNGIDSI